MTALKKTSFTNQLEVVMVPDAMLAVDLGKTSCRIRLTVGTDILVEQVAPGAPGLAEAHGEELAFAAITEATTELTGAERQRISAIGIGAAGVEASPDPAQSLAKRIRESFGAPTALINDALVAHVGAFGGSTGSVLITGTGAIAFSFDQSGELKQVDGWGPLLGDDGGGRWIGQEGIKAALREADGRSSSTSLTQAAADLAGDLRALPAWVSATGHDARRLASFAPTVLAHAQDGDPIAAEIVHKAAAQLTKTVEAAGGREQGLCIVGGLYEHPYFQQVLTDALAAAGITVDEPLGSPLDGAALIATNSTLPHESRVFRV